MEATEVTPPGLDGRQWNVTYRGITHRILVSGRELTSTPQGSVPHRVPWTDAEIRNAIRYALEAFGSISEPLQLALRAEDLYRGNGLL
jgi:hypothetical protein